MNWERNMIVWLLGRLIVKKQSSTAAHMQLSLVFTVGESYTTSCH